MTMRRLKTILPILAFVVFAAAPVHAQAPDTASGFAAVDVLTAVTRLIIHSDVKTSFAEKIFGAVVPRLCRLCDAKPAFVASVLISTHKEVREKGLDRKFIPVVMNYNRIVGIVEGIYNERGITIERRSEFCKTLAAMYMTLRPQAPSAAAAVTDIIDAYTVFLGNNQP